MKHSKIFLAVTAGLLAVVGFISAKAHKHFNSLTFYSLREPGVTPICTVKVTHLATVTPTASPIGYTKYSNPCSGKTVQAGGN
jgi:hypothetical protein